MKPLPNRTRPIGVDRFDDEREARLAGIEAAPDAEESWAVRQRVADHLREWVWEWARRIDPSPRTPGEVADAVLALVRGEQP